MVCWRAYSIYYEILIIIRCISQRTTYLSCRANHTFCRCAIIIIITVKNCYIIPIISDCTTRNNFLIFVCCEKFV